MDLFSMFKGEAKPQQQQQNQSQNQQNDFRQTGGQSIQSSDNGIQPNQQGQQQQQQQQDPLDSFNSIWQNPNTAGKEGQVAKGPEGQKTSYVNLDQEGIKKFVGGINFTKDIPQELMQAASSGDMGALIQIINGVGQSALAQSLHFNGHVVNESLNSGFSQFNSSLESKFKDYSSKDRLYSSEDAKVLSHPAIQPLVETARRQILQNNPAATSAEVQQQLVSYFKEVSSAINPSQQQSQQTGNTSNQADNIQDFSSFFNNQKSMF